MTDLDTALAEDINSPVAEAEAAIMELSSEFIGDDQWSDSRDEVQRTQSDETTDERVARLERETEELRRHEAGLRSGLIEQRQRAASMQQERDALFESLSNIDQRLAERNRQPVNEGWMDEVDSDRSPAAAQDPTAHAISELRQRFEREDAEKQVRQTISQVITATVKSEEDFVSQNPDIDYLGAVRFAESYHKNLLLAQGYNEQAAEQALNEGKLTASYNVMSTGQNPAHALVNYARSLGWDGRKQPTDAPQGQVPARAKPPKTIANTGRPPARTNQNNSLQYLYKNDPAKFRRIAADPEAFLEYEKRIAIQQGIPQGP